VSVKVDGGRLREAREDADLSQRELGEKAGVSPDTILRMEAGEGGAYGRTVRKISKALGVSYEELVEGADRGKVPAR